MVCDITNRYCRQQQSQSDGLLMHVALGSIYVVIIINDIIIIIIDDTSFSKALARPSKATTPTELYAQTIVGFGRSTSQQGLHNHDDDILCRRQYCCRYRHNVHTEKLRQQ